MSENKMLIAKLQLVSSELDHWENGCTGEYSVNFWDLEFKAENEQKLIDKITSHFDVTVDHLQFNACEEIGRLDVQLQTLDKFDEFQLSKNQFDEFKRGYIKAYLTTFSFQVYEQLPFNLITEDI
jgi:hypothetical protein